MSPVRKLDFTGSKPTRSDCVSHSLKKAFLKVNAYFSDQLWQCKLVQLLGEEHETRPSKTDKLH